jgi:hypothetical protein
MILPTTKYSARCFAQQFKLNLEFILLFLIQISAKLQSLNFESHQISVCEINQF